MCTRWYLFKQVNAVDEGSGHEGTRECKQGEAGVAKKPVEPHQQEYEASDHGGAR
ncbi:MAG: hypothetical protein ACLFNX_05805 [Spirochaetaceae bacterium]